MSSPEEAIASGRPKRRAAQPPPVGFDIEGRDAATGSCHCCGGMLRRTPESARQCGKCGARYHAYDCGNRRRDAGFTDSDQCPRCAEMCMCTGGPMLCHTRSLRDSRREKRQHTVGSSSAPSTIDGFRKSASPTDSEETRSLTRMSEEPSTHEDSARGLQRPRDVDSAEDSDGPREANHNDSAPHGAASYSRCEYLPADLRFENDALRVENEALRQRLAAGRGSTEVKAPEPRRIEEMISNGASGKVDYDADGAVEIFFPEEAPDGDREPPFSCFNASHSMYIGDAWSVEIVQAYRERVAARGGFDAGPLTETADKRKIFWRNVWFFTRMAMILLLLYWSISWSIAEGDVMLAAYLVMYVVCTVWAYHGYRNLLAYGRMVLADRTRKRKKAIADAESPV